MAPLEEEKNCCKMYNETSSLTRLAQAQWHHAGLKGMP
jgi:hypothetical protein